MFSRSALKVGWNVALAAGIALSLAGKGCPRPGPTPPVPPVPPGPIPPGPKPPTPIPSGDLRVLMVVDPANTTTSEAQMEILYGKQMRDWLDAHTPVGSDGKTHEWRLWPPGMDTSNESQVWQELYKRADKPPCMVISKGTRTDVVPLPGTVDEATTLLGKYVT